MSAAEKRDDKIVISEEAVSVLTEAKGDLPKAVDLFVARVHRDRELRDVLTEPLLRTACYQALIQVHRSRRKAIWYSSQPSAERETARVIALAGGTIASLLDFPLPGGKRLRDATGSEITAAAEFYHSQASDMALKARWLRLVGQSIPHDEVAGKYVTEDELNRIREEVSHG
jgi:hypothetical protein